MMRTNRSVFLLATTMLMLGATTALCEEPTSKTKIDDKAREVWERALKLQYGEIAKTRSIKSLRMLGEMSIPAQGLTAKMEMHQGQNQMTMTIDIPNLGKMREGYTGKHAWAFSELQGPVLKSEAETRQAQQQSDIYASLDWEKYYSELKYEGEESIEDYDGKKRDTQVLKMVSKDGETTTKGYFDAKTGQQIRMDAEVLVQGGMKLPSVVLMTDFRRVDGLMLPFKLKSSMGPIEQLITFQKIATNVSFPEDTFKAPTEVQELIDDSDD